MQIPRPERGASCSLWLYRMGQGWVAGPIPLDPGLRICQRHLCQGSKQWCCFPQLFPFIYKLLWNQASSQLCTKAWLQTWPFLKCWCFPVSPPQTGHSVPPPFHLIQKLSWMLLYKNTSLAILHQGFDWEATSTSEDLWTSVLKKGVKLASEV